MFEMKYDKNKNPIPQPELVQQQLAAAEAIDNALQPPTEPEPIEQEAELKVESPDVDFKQEQPMPVSNKELNLRALREKAERAERERDELARRFQEMELQRHQYQKPTQQPMEEEGLGIGDSEIAEGKHLSKMDRKINKIQQQFDQRLQQQHQAYARALTQAQIKSQYPDFDYVVSQDNVAVLEARYPEIAKTLGSSNDLYSTAVSAYTMIKKLGIMPDEVQVQEKAQLMKNIAKPKPMASLSPQLGDSPLSKANAFANGLTKELKQQLLKEMNDIRKSS